MSITKQIVHKRIALVSLVLCVATLPFSVKLCHLCIIALVVSWLFEGDWRVKFSVVNQSLFLQLILTYICMLILGLAFADDLASGLFSLEKKIFFILLPLCLATTSVKLSEREVKGILLTFVGACFVGSVFCIFHAWQESNLVFAGEHVINPYLSGSQYTNLHPQASDKWLVFSYVSLANGINIHPTYFSLFLAFCIILLLNELSSLQTPMRKIATVTAIFYFCLFIIFLSSRIIIISVAIILLFVVIKCMFRKEKLPAFLTMVLTILFCLLLVLNPVSRYRSLEEIDQSTFEIDEGSNYTTAAQIRLSLWWVAVKSLANWNPVIGYGTGDIEKVMQKTSNELQITNSINSVDPHNQFLYTLISNGIPAALTLSLLLVLSPCLAWRQKDFLLLGFSFLIILLCLTESALELQKGIVFYSLFTGLLSFQLYSFQNFGLKFKTLLHVGQ